MSKNITLMGASYTAVPAVQLPQTGGGTALFTDVSDTTAAAADVAEGKYFYTAAGVLTEGTGSGGGGGVTRENIVPQQTITATVGYNGLTSTAVLIEGADYEYTVNGETRLGTAVDVNGTLQLGDGDYYWYEQGGCFVADGGVMYFRTSAAGSYTVKVDKITLANSGITTEVIFPEQSVTATTPDATGYTANINVTERLTEGENYIVTMDGTSYLCYAHAKYGGIDIYLGDDNVIWGNASQAQYPFCCATWGSGVTAWGVANTSAHTVKIEKVLSFDSAELGTKTITANGTYSASSDDLDGYSSVTVNVSGGSVNIGTATTTNSSNQNTSIDFTLPSGRTPKAFFCRLTSQIARNSSSRYYYVYDMRWDGSSTGGVAGNTFYMYSGTLSNVTSGYSKSQDGTTFTLSSTGTRSTSPGSFFNGTYELVYVY